MSTFSEHTTIAADREDVWACLADVGQIAEWNPGLAGSHRTNEIDGLGAARHCEISDKQFLTEEVIHFEPASAITFRITESNMPFKEADIAFRLTDTTTNGETSITVEPVYELNYGPIGKLLNVLVVKRAYQKGMRDLLEGLRQHVEGKASH